MTDYSELKRLAEAAAEAQAVWFAVVPEGAAVNPTGSALLIGPRRRDLDRMVAYAREDAHFIAAANPAAVLALIAENERLNSLVTATSVETDRVIEMIGRGYAVKKEQLKAEVEALRKDAERFDWFDANFQNESDTSLRESIDAAMTKEQSE